ncbi:hypothetical protein [Streptomyces sp. NBC_01724]|uniref:hypothetical protein n=1 Tax=Streptomyces sp. NBC_01724 TaxID=2975922 RepID=UPI003FCD3DA8
MPTPGNEVRTHAGVSGRTVDNSAVALAISSSSAKKKVTSAASTAAGGVPVRLRQLQDFARGLDDLRGLRPCDPGTPTAHEADQAVDSEASDAVRAGAPSMKSKRGVGGCPAWPGSGAEQFALDGREERLGEGVVPALAGAAD